MKLSVIVPTHNNESELTACLDSLINQKLVKLNQDYEVIVVNDASTDQTASIINQFSVTNLELQQNQGRIKARQLGAEAAQTENLLFIDARVIVDHYFVSQLLKMLNYPAILAGKQQLQKKTKSVAQYISQFFWLLRQTHYGRHVFPSAKYSYWINQANFKNSPKGLGAFFIKKNWWQKIQPSSSKHNHNDDTKLLHNLVFNQNIPIWRSNKLSWTYQSRQSVWQTVNWLFQRGQKYASFYFLNSLQQDLIGILILILISTVWKVALPQLLFLLAAAIFTVFAYLINQGFNLIQSLQTISLLPVAGLIFSSGVLKVIIKNRFKTWLSIAILVLLFQYLIQNWSSLVVITQIESAYLWGIFPLYILFYFSNAVFIRQLIGIYYTKISIPTASGVSVISSFINNVVPFRAGMTWRAHFLKSNFKFPYSQFVLTILANYLLVFHINSLVGLLALLLLPTTYQISAQWMVLLLLLSTWIATSIALWTPSLTEKLEVLSSWRFSNDQSKSKLGNLFTIPRFIKKGLQGWKILQAKPRTLAFLITLALLNLVINATIFGLELMSLGFLTSLNTHSVISWLLMASVSSLSLLLSITPAALGIREALLAITSSWLGLTPAALVTVSILDRAINMISLLAMTPIAWLILNKQYLKK